mgnify:CR=1 FL=1
MSVDPHLGRPGAHVVLRVRDGLFQLEQSDLADIASRQGQARQGIFLLHFIDLGIQFKMKDRVLFHHYLLVFRNGRNQDADKKNGKKEEGDHGDQGPQAG